MANGRGTLGLVLLVGLAGCSGYFTGFDNPQPTPTPNSTVHVAAPGVTAEGVTDPGRVARAHAAAFDNQSYTRRSVTTVNTTHGTSARATQILKAGPSGNRLQLTNYSEFADVAYGSDGSPPFREEAIWWNGNYTYIAQYGFVDSDVGYARHKRDTIARIVPRVERNIEILTLFNDTNVSEITYKGWVAYRLEASASHETIRSQENFQPADIHVVAIIDAFGRLHELRIMSASDNFFLIHDGAEVTNTITYTDIGNTTLERPDWVETAKNHTAKAATPPGTSTNQRSN